MTARSRTTLPLALALGFASLTFARPAAAQDVSLAPTSAAISITAADSLAPTASSAASAAPAGPTFSSASVAVRHAELPVAATAPRRAGYGQPVALMVVGGAALLTGLIIGDDAGTAIAVGGVVVGLVGLYQYLQ